MLYTVIWNRATAQRGEFLILGGAAQDKKNVTSVFKTGAKKALVALHLLGHTVIVSSSDEQGDYFYQVISKRTPLGDIVVGVYNNGYPDEKMVETTYTTAIADNAWLEPMNGNRCARAFGQFVLNAVGTAGDNWGILRDVEDVVPAPSGQTRVYIPQTPEVERIVDNLDDYFCFGRVPIAEQEARLRASEGPVTVQVFSRPATGGLARTRIFVMGALAYCEEPWNKAFRYEYGIMGDQEGRYLSEERHIRDIRKVRSLLEKAYAQAIREGNRPMVRALIQALAFGEGEMSIWQTGRILRDEFYEEFGSRAVVVANDVAAIIADRIRRPLVGLWSAGILWALTSSGVENALDADELKEGRREKPLTRSEERDINKDLEVLTAAGLAVDGAVTYVTFTCVNPQDKTKGFHKHRDGLDKIGILKELMKDQAERRRILVHEHRHLITEAHDGTAGFINRADRDLVRLATTLHERR